MSLTKQDLRAIKGIVEETVEVQLESKLEEKLDSKLEEKLESKLEEKLESKLEEKLDSKLEEKLDSKLEEKLESKLEEKLESKLKPLKKDIHYIKKTLNLMIERYDPMVVDHERRLDKVETVLKI